MEKINKRRIPLIGRRRVKEFVAEIIKTHKPDTYLDYVVLMHTLEGDVGFEMEMRAAKSIPTDDDDGHEEVKK